MDLVAAAARLEAHFRAIHTQRMQGLPILNPQLDVCPVGFRAFGEHAVGVLITPWFLNLVLLPGTDEWSESPQGGVASITFPGSEIEFHVTHDDELGTFLSAALFSSVADFPDQDTAVDIATEVLDHLFAPSAESRASASPSMSRREFFSGLGAD